MALALVGCNALFGVDGLEYVSEPSSSATGTAGQGGAGGAGGMEMEAGGGGNGGRGGSPSPALSDEGVLVRYFLDEASMGQPALPVRDATPEPLDLTMTWDGAAGYTLGPGGRGIELLEPGHAARATGLIATTKVDQRLSGATTMTVEVVFDAISPIPNFASVVDLDAPGSNNNRLALSFQNSVYPSIEFNDFDMGVDVNGIWDVAVVDVGRIVVHLVIDTMEPMADDRAKLYVDAVRAAPLAPSPVANIPIQQGEAFDVGCVDCALALGHDVAGTPNREFLGRIYYAALYDRALDDDEVIAHAQLLSADDDPPRP